MLYWMLNTSENKKKKKNLSTLSMLLKPNFIAEN